MHVEALGTAHGRDPNLPYCGRDLDGDGKAISKGEVVECAQYRDGNLCPWDRQECEEKTATSGEKTHVCPAGKQYECVKTSDKTYECSPWPCAQPQYTLGEIAGVSNDGTVTGKQCNAQFHIFPGTPRECRYPGFDSNYQNCCRADAAGHHPIAGSDWEKGCSHTEWHTDKARCDRLLVAVGDYCSTWLPVQERLCIQERLAYCFFHSPIASITHELARPQLKAFVEQGIWGSPMDPLCRGFSPVEWQMIDVGRISKEIAQNGKAFLIKLMAPHDESLETHSGPCTTDGEDQQKKLDAARDLVEKKTGEAAEKKAAE